MKRIFTLFSLFLSSTLMIAQEAPDFTVTTVHGEEFNLYTELDEGKTIVVDIFFVNCPPCNGIAPFIQDLNLKWGDGAADVEFISLTDVDTNAEIIPYEELHSLTFPAAGTDGGGSDAVAPYKSGSFGQFFGYPTILVIAPDKTVNYDVWGSSFQETTDLLDAAIEQTGATGEVTSVYESGEISEINAFPNPVLNSLQVTFELVKSGNVIAYIMDTNGRVVSENQLGRLISGEQSISLDFQNIASGTYFIELRNEDQLLSSFNVVK